MNTPFTFEAETIDYAGVADPDPTVFPRRKTWNIGSPARFQHEGETPVTVAAPRSAALSRSPALLHHPHIRTTCSSSRLVRDATPIVMTPANMNPGFVGANDSIQVDAGLQRALTNLMVTKYPRLLARQSVANQQAGRDDRIRVALVDLTGNKLCRPAYAGWGSTVAMSGASTAKIAIFYAVAQLVFDVRELVRNKGLATTAATLRETDKLFKPLACKPDVRWLFEFDQSARLVNAKPSTKLTQTMLDIVEERRSTPNASELIVRLGFDYIASVLRQSGLRHPSRGGLWLGSTYCTGRTRAPVTSGCHVLTACQPQLSRYSWKNDPLGIRRVVLTALSAATFMTLLAQGRLVSPPQSNAIEAFLARACTWFGSALPGATVRAAKCGLTSELLHDAGLIENGGRRYAIAYLTRGANAELSARNRSVHSQLIQDLDQLIAANNP